MRFIKTLSAVLVILVCPCAFCYGQLSFSGVNGEKGYAALRGQYKLDLDNGLVLTPEYGYYRRSDKEEDEAGSTSRYGLQASYDVTDDWTAYALARGVPLALDFQSIEYAAGVRWVPFYKKGMFKAPLLGLQAGQIRYDVYSDALDNPLEHAYSPTETFARAEAETYARKLRLRGIYRKVIKYSSQPPSGVSTNWADVPFMVAVVQGFIKESSALQLAYPTRNITPYASWVRYKYADHRAFATAVSAGIALHFWDMDFSGGVEVFEPKRQANRKTYFSMTVESKF